MIEARARLVTRCLLNHVTQIAAQLFAFAYIPTIISHLCFGFSMTSVFAAAAEKHSKMCNLCMAGGL
jgi:hypothetical protein